MGRIAEYLADTSALGRLHKPIVHEVLAPLIQRGTVGVSGTVELEMLYSARNVAEHEAIRTYLKAFDWFAVFDECWERAIEVHSALCDNGRHRSVPMPDRFRR